MLQTLHTKGFSLICWENEYVGDLTEALRELEIYTEGWYLDPYEKLIQRKEITSPVLITPDGMFFGKEAIRSYISLRRFLDLCEIKEEKSRRAPQLQVQFCFGCGTNVGVTSIVTGGESKAEYTCDKCKIHVVITAKPVSFMKIRKAAS